LKSEDGPKSAVVPKGNQPSGGQLRDLPLAEVEGFDALVELALDMR